MKMVGVALSNGGTALVDADDLDIVGQYTWRESPYGYVYRGVWLKFSEQDKTHIQSKRKGGKVKVGFLHRMIAEKHGIVGPGEFVDHINRNKLDNRKSNLRKATPRQNALNRKMRADNKTGIVGVFYRKDKVNKPWHAQAGGKTKSFSNQAEAIAWRNEMHEQVLKLNNLWEAK